MPKVTIYSQCSYSALTTEYAGSDAVVALTRLVLSFPTYLRCFVIPAKAGIHFSLKKTHAFSH